MRTAFMNKYPVNRTKHNTDTDETLDPGKHTG